MVAIMVTIMVTIAMAVAVAVAVAMSKVAHHVQTEKRSADAMEARARRRDRKTDSTAQHNTPATPRQRPRPPPEGGAPPGCCGRQSCG
eukprot:2532435-Rhodomonas_salina.1